MAKSEKVNVRLEVNGAGKASSEVDKLNKSVKKLDNQAGLAGATLIQVGNGIGDIRYGFGAVANNISQVGSLFGTLVAQAGSVTKALKSLRAAIAGPIGIMLAFQAVVAAIDFFASRTDNAEKAANGLTNAISGTAGQRAKLDVLAESYKTAAEGSDLYKGALQDLKKLGFDPVTQSIDDFIEKQKELVIFQATSKYFENQINEIVNQRMKIEEELDEALKLENRTKTSTVSEGGKTIMRDTFVLSEGEVMMGFEPRFKELDEKLKGYRDKYNATQKQILAILGGKVVEETGEEETSARPTANSVSELTPAGGTDMSTDPLVLNAKMRSEAIINIEKGLANEMSKIRTTDLILTKANEDAKLAIKIAAADGAMKVFGMLKNLDGMGRDGMKAMLIAEHGASVAKQLFSFNQANIAATAHAATMGPLGAAYLTKSLALNKINLGVGLAGTGVALANGLTAINRGGGAGSTPNASAAAGSVLSPQFNIVGQGQQASLAEAIGANVATAVSQEPIKAYVVATDVTTQQEIDRRSDDLSSI